MWWGMAAACRCVVVEGSVTVHESQTGPNQVVERCNTPPEYILDNDEQYAPFVYALRFRLGRHTSSQLPLSLKYNVVYCS